MQEDHSISRTILFLDSSAQKFSCDGLLQRDFWLCAWDVQDTPKEYLIYYPLTGHLKVISNISVGRSVHLPQCKRSMDGTEESILHMVLQ